MIPITRLARGAACAALWPLAALAQTAVPPTAPSGNYGGADQVQAVGLVWPDPTTGAAHVARPGDPFPVSCISGCSGGGGGGGGGVVTETAGGFVDLTTIIASLSTLTTTDNGLFKAGQSIGNTAFAISGTLPPFAATPTVNIGSAQTVTATSAISQPQVQAGSAATYAAGALLGAVQSFSGQPSTGIVQFATASLAGSALFSGSIDLVLFNAPPTGTYTDNAAFSLAAADYGRLIGVVHLTDVTALGGGASLVQGQDVAMPYALGAGTTLYALVVFRGAGQTFAAANGATISISVVK